MKMSNLIKKDKNNFRDLLNSVVFYIGDTFISGTKNPEKYLKLLPGAKNNVELQKSLLEYKIRNLSKDDIDIEERWNSIENFWEGLSSIVQKDYIIEMMKEISQINDGYNSISKKTIEKIINLWSKTSKEAQKESATNVIDWVSNKCAYEKESLLTSLAQKTDKNIILENLERYCEILGLENNENNINTIKDMYKKNDELFSTLNPRILDEKYVNYFGKEKIEEISLYPELQDNIVHLDDKKMKLLEILMKNEEQQTWKSTIERLTENLNAFYNRDLNKELVKEEIMAELAENDDLRQNLLNIYSSRRNIFKITNFDEVRDFVKIRENFCMDILNNYTNDELLPMEVDGKTDSDKIRFAILQMFFGITLEEAKDLVNDYGQGIENYKSINDVNENAKEEFDEIDYVCALKNILYEDIDIIRNNMVKEEISHNEFNSSFVLDIKSKLKRDFAKKYNDTLYKIEEQIPESTVEYKGKEIPIYNAGTDFNMIITVIGAYSKYEEPENFSDDWNRPKMGTKHFCVSYIGNNSIAMAKPKGPIFGFEDLEEDSLLASAPIDIASERKRSNKLANFFMRGKSKFLLPKDMIDNTRHGHNEMNYERWVVEKDGTLKKQKPSYVIYTTNGESKKKYEKNSDWRQTKKAAAQLGIPIVIIDKVECAKSEVQKMNERLEKLKTMDESTLDPDLITEMIVEFGNNRAGSQYDNKIFDKYFSNNKYKKYIEDILNIINRNSKITEQQKKTCLSTLSLALNNEITKIEPANVSKKVKKFNKTCKAFIDKIEIDDKVNTAMHSKKQVEQNKDVTIMITQIENSQNNIITPDSLNQVNNAITEIRQMDLYDQKAHSTRHIQDVVLFSAIMADKEGLSDRDKQLLIEAAKFHDCGRINDNDEKHGEKSAEIAEKILKEQGIYTEEEIKIIKTAIIYHDTEEKTEGILDKKTCMAKCIENNVSLFDYKRTMKICELLKDADALDRTRFSNNAKLDPNQLRSESSKTLIEFSEQLNEAYSKSDIEEYIEAHPYLDKEEIHEKAEQETGKITIKKIRLGEYVPKFARKIVQEISEKTSDKNAEVEKNKENDNSFQKENENFTEQKIGKSTIKTLTLDKDKAKNMQMRDEEMLEQLQENDSFQK